MTFKVKHLPFQSHSHGQIHGSSAKHTPGLKTCPLPPLEKEELLSSSVGLPDQKKTSCQAVAKPGQADCTTKKEHPDTQFQGDS